MRQIAFYLNACFLGGPKGKAVAEYYRRVLTLTVGPIPDGFDLGLLHVLILDKIRTWFSLDVFSDSAMMNKNTKPKALYGCFAGYHNVFMLLRNSSVYF